MTVQRKKYFRSVRNYIISYLHKSSKITNRKKAVSMQSSFSWFIFACVQHIMHASKLPSPVMSAARGSDAEPFRRS